MPEVAQMCRRAESHARHDIGRVAQSSGPTQRLYPPSTFGWRLTVQGGIVDVD